MDSRFLYIDSWGGFGASDSHELPKAENLAPKILQRLDDAKIVDTLIGHKVYQNKGYMQARDNLHTRSVGAQEQPPPPRNLERIANREQRSGSRD